MAEPSTGKTPEPGKSQEPEGEKRFSQEEVNRIVGQRVREVEGKFADYPVLKKAADELANLKHTQLSSEEKLREELAAAKLVGEQRGRQMAEIAIRAEVRTMAVQKGLIDPDAALALVDRTAIQYGEDGTVKGVAEALDALVAAKPYLRSSPHAANVNPGAGAPAPMPVKLTDQQRMAAKAMGIKEEDYAKNVRR